MYQTVTCLKTIILNKIKAWRSLRTPKHWISAKQSGLNHSLVFYICYIAWGRAKIYDCMKTEGGILYHCYFLCNRDNIYSDLAISRNIVLPWIVWYRKSIGFAHNVGTSTTTEGLYNVYTVHIMGQVISNLNEKYIQANMEFTFMITHNRPTTLLENRQNSCRIIYLMCSVHSKYMYTRVFL